MWRGRRSASARSRSSAYVPPWERCEDEFPVAMCGWRGERHEADMQRGAEAKRQPKTEGTTIHQQSNLIHQKSDKHRLTALRGKSNLAI